MIAGAIAFFVYASWVSWLMMRSCLVSRFTWQIAEKNWFPIRKRDLSGLTIRAKTWHPRYGNRAMGVVRPCNGGSIARRPERKLSRLSPSPLACISIC